MVRCKANWLQSGEKSSKYFFALEKHKFNQRNLNTLHSVDGIIINNQKPISQELIQFYKVLYTSRGIEVDEANLQDLDFPKLSQLERDLLVRVMDLDEIEEYKTDVF